MRGLLIQNSDQSDKIIAAAKRLGIYYKDFDKYTNDIDSYNLFFLGSINGVKYLSRYSECTLFCDWDKFTCIETRNIFYPYLPTHKAAYFTVGDLRNRNALDIMFDIISPLYQTVFIRPNKSSKPFGGRVVSKETIQELLSEIDYLNIPSSELILVSSKVPIEAEFRVVINGCNTITGSIYSGTGDLNKAMESAEIMVNERKYYPHPLFIVDIVKLLNDSNYYFLESGSVNCGGFYDCDLEVILKSIMDY